MSEKAFLPPDPEQACASQLLEWIASPRSTRCLLQTKYGEALSVSAVPLL